MKITTRILTVGLAIGAIAFGNAQEEETKSNIQTFTPSKLLKKGQWDIKTFNGLYTQTKKTDEGSKSGTIPRENFFTSTNEVYTGISETSRINVGLIVQVRSNTFNGSKALSVGKLKNDRINSRFGVSQIAPSIRIQPFKNIGNFSVTSSLWIPVFKDAPGVFLDQRSLAWENKFFYDRTFGGNKWQLFTEADFKFNFGDSLADADSDENGGERFAGDSLFLPLSVFLSYFPSSKSTVFINAQQAFLIGFDNEFAVGGENFSQRFTSLGLGAKYQLTRVTNLEASYSNIVTGHNLQGLGQTFSLGARFLF